MVEILTSPNVAFNLAGGWVDSLSSFGPSVK